MAAEELQNTNVFSRRIRHSDKAVAATYTNSRLKHIRQDPQRRQITENSWKNTQAQRKRERQGKEMAGFDITKILNKQTTAQTENAATEDFEEIKAGLRKNYDHREKQVQHERH